MSERRKLSGAGRESRSLWFPIISVGVITAGAFGLSRAFEDHGIDAVETISSISPVCRDISENDVAARRRAVGEAYTRYVVHGSGNIGNNFDNWERATAGCNVSYFTFTPVAETEPRERLIEPPDAPVE